MRRTVALLAALVVALGLAGCGDDDDSTASSSDSTTTTTAAATSTTATTATTAAPAAGTTVAIGDSSLGPVAVDAEGMTLYMFKPDSVDASACADACAQTWLPLTVDGTPAGGEGVDTALLATAPRADGSSQVTYNGHRLYRYSGDAAAGDTNGQGIGDVWFALTSAGEPVQA
jgi:predicted lipoprotein with Yx(FWY)xxD motif